MNHVDLKFDYTITTIIMQTEELTFEKKIGCQEQNVVLSLIQWQVRINVNEERQVGIYASPILSYYLTPYNFSYTLSFLSEKGNPTRRTYTVNAQRRSDEEYSLYGQHDICHLDDLPLQADRKNFLVRFTVISIKSKDHASYLGILDHFLRGQSIDATYLKKIQDLEKSLREEKRRTKNTFDLVDEWEAKYKALKDQKDDGGDDAGKPKKKKKIDVEDLADKATLPQLNEAIDKLEKDLGTLTEKRDNLKRCVVCLGRDKETICMPCEHMAACDRCIHTIQEKTNKCPICRAEIASIIRPFV